MAEIDAVGGKGIIRWTNGIPLLRVVGALGRVVHPEFRVGAVSAALARHKAEPHVVLFLGAQRCAALAARSSIDVLEILPDGSEHRYACPVQDRRGEAPALPAFLPTRSI